MPRPTSPSAARPAFDLTEDDLRALMALPPPYPERRDERIRAVLAAWWAHADRPGLVAPTERGVVTSTPVRLAPKALRRLDRERGDVSRGAYLRAIIDASG